MDLIGLEVYTEENELLGKLKEVLQPGANDVYVVKNSEGEEILFPAIKDCVKEVDLENGVITLHVMDGLLD